MECMFCLEQSTPEYSVITMDFRHYLKCECKVHSHANCWMMYIIHKGRVECPICHTLLQQMYRPPLHVAHVPTIVIRREVREIRDEPLNARAVLLFICMFVGMIIFLVILRH